MRNGKGLVVGGAALLGIGGLGAIGIVADTARVAARSKSISALAAVENASALGAVREQSTSSTMLLKRLDELRGTQAESVDPAEPGALQQALDIVDSSSDVVGLAETSQDVMDREGRSPDQSTGIGRDGATMARREFLKQRPLQFDEDWIKEQIANAKKRDLDLNALMSRREAN